MARTPSAGGWKLNRVEAFDEQDPTLLVKRVLPSGVCLRLNLQMFNVKLSLAETPEEASFFQLYEWTAERLQDAVTTALTWDGTGHPCGWIRAVPPVLYDYPDEEESTITDATPDPPSA